MADGRDARAEVERMAALYGRQDARVEQLRVPPQSVESEQAVLGGLMLAPDAYDRISDELSEADFYRRDHQLIYRAIRELAEKGKPRDAVTLAEWFESQGLGEQVAGGAYLVELASTTPSAANIRAYAEIVRDKATLRRLIEFGTGVVNDGFEPDGREVAEILAEANNRLVELQPQQRGGLRAVAESLPGWYGRYAERFDRKAAITGLATPWSELNRVTHGLQPATLYLIAGRPSMGKSVMGLNLAQAIAMRGKTVALFSLEMSEDECHNRNIAALAEIPLDWVSAPDAEHDYHGRLSDAYRQMRDAPLFIDDTPALTQRQFVARARRMHRKRPLDLLVIDHIHDFSIDARLARSEYGAIAQAAKNLGKEWNIPVVALAQLNRSVTGRTDKRPTLADLRESGELEQKGDVIILLHREDYYDTPEERTHLQGVVEAHIAKGRSIKAGARINLLNRFDQARLDDWEGPLPPEPKKTNGKKGSSVGFDFDEMDGRTAAAGGDR
jgi:replicative DNA helicase